MITTTDMPSRISNTLNPQGSEPSRSTRRKGVRSPGMKANTFSAQSSLGLSHMLLAVMLGVASATSLASSDSSQVAVQFNPGDRIEGNYKGDGIWYPATYHGPYHGRCTKCGFFVNSDADQCSKCGNKGEGWKADKWRKAKIVKMFESTGLFKGLFDDSRENCSKDEVAVEYYSGLGRFNLDDKDPDISSLEYRSWRNIADYGCKSILSFYVPLDKTAVQQKPNKTCLQCKGKGQVGVIKGEAFKHIIKNPEISRNIWKPRRWAAKLRDARDEYDAAATRRLMTSIPPIEPFDGQNFALSVSALAGMVIGALLGNTILKRCFRKANQPLERTTDNDYEYLERMV